MKKRIVIGILTAAMAIMLTGCGAKSSDTSAYYDALSEAAAAGDYAYSYDKDTYEVAEEAYENPAAEEVGEINESTEALKNDRKLIKTIDMTVETYNFTELTAKIEDKTEALGGYVESGSVSGSEADKNRYARYTLRIPKDKADGFVELVSGQSNITEKSESVEDVTLNYVDSESRKNSLKVEYDRLEQLLSQADDIEELIYIEERLAEVRYQIESIEAQLRTYDNKVNYTTIYLYVKEVFEYTAPEVVNPTFGERLVRALGNAFENIGKGIQNFTIFFIVAIPYIIVIGIPVAIIFFIVNKIVKKSNKKLEEKRAEAKAKKEEEKKIAEQKKAEEQNNDKEESSEEKAIPYSEKMAKKMEQENQEND